MNRATGMIFTFVLLLLFGCTTGTVPRARQLLEAPRITPAKLREMLKHEKVPIVDVRAIEVYNHSKYKIAGAIYEDPRRIESWAHEYPKDRPLVFY